VPRRPLLGLAGHTEICVAAQLEEECLAVRRDVKTRREVLREPSRAVTILAATDVSLVASQSFG
jgi:hypothetical protein